MIAVALGLADRRSPDTASPSNVPETASDALTTVSPTAQAAASTTAVETPILTTQDSPVVGLAEPVSEPPSGEVFEAVGTFYAVADSPGGMQIHEYLLILDSSPQGTHEGWVLSPNLCERFGVPVEATAVALHLKAKAVIPDWSNEKSTAVIALGVQRPGNDLDTHLAVHSRVDKAAGQHGIVEEDIANVTAVVGVRDCQFDLFTSLSIVNHGQVERAVWLTGYYLP